MYTEYANLLDLAMDIVQGPDKDRLLLEVPLSYRLNVQRSERALAEILTFSDETWALLAEKDFQDWNNLYKLTLQKHEERMTRYASMEAELRTWVPPTTEYEQHAEEFEDIKERMTLVMADLLAVKAPEAPTALTWQDYKALRLKAAERALASARKNLEYYLDEVKRNEVLIQKLKESFPSK